MDFNKPLRYYSPIVQKILNSSHSYEVDEPKNNIKLEKDKNNTKLEKDKNIYNDFKSNIISVKHDFSCQSGDKAYKKIMDQTPDAELIKSVERLFLENPSKDHHGRARGPSRKQRRTQHIKSEQLKSYQQAAKDRSKRMQKAFDNCAKYVSELEPQMKFGLEDSTMNRITGWITRFQQMATRPFRVDVKVDPMSPILDYVRDFLNDEYNFLLAFGSVATVVYFTKSTWAIMTLCALVGYAIKERRQWISDIMKQYGVFDDFSISRWLSDMTTSEPDIKFEDSDLNPQGAADDLIDPISDGIFSLIFMKVFHSSYKNRNLTSLNRELGSFSRTRQGVSDFVNWFFQRLGRFVQWVGKILDTEIPELVSFEDADVMEFSKGVAMLVNDFDDGITVNYDFFIRVSQLKKIGERLYAETIPNARDRRNALRSVLNRLQPLIDKCRSGNVVNNGPRRTPLAILIGGAPGVGKSFTSVPFLHELIARVIDESSLEYFRTNPNDYILNRIWENSFWDADHAQFCIVYDDFGQSPNAVLTKENEYMEIVRGVNSLNFPLTMASLVDKGSTNYQHQLVFATTNKSRMADCMGVSSPEAVVRRFKIGVWLAPRKEYCLDPNVGITQRRLDVSKLKGIFDENVHEFFDYDFLNGQFINEHKSYTYREFVERAVLAYERNMAKEDLSLKNMKDSIDKGIAYRRKLQTQDGDYELYSYWVSSVILACGTLAAMSVKYAWPNLRKAKLLGPQLGDDSFNAILASDIHKTDISDEHLLPINRELLALAISKASFVNIDVARRVANSFVPDRDLVEWVRLNKAEIDDAVREEVAGPNTPFRKLMGGAMGAARYVGNTIRSHPTLTKLAAAALVMVPIVIKVRAFVTALIPQSREAGVQVQRDMRASRAARVGKMNWQLQDQSSDIPAASPSTTDFMNKVTAHNVYDLSWIRIALVVVVSCLSLIM